jgi:hypothetical protein
VAHQLNRSTLLYFLFPDPAAQEIKEIRLDQKEKEKKKYAAR